MGKLQLLLFERLQLPFFQPGLLQTAETGLAVVPLLIQARDFPAQLLPFLFQRTQAAPGGSGRFQGIGISGIMVQDPEAEKSVGQQQGLVLGMDIHQPGG